MFPDGSGGTGSGSLEAEDGRVLLDAGNVDAAVEVEVAVEDGTLSDSSGGSTYPDCPLSDETGAGGFAELPDVPDDSLSETGGST